MSDFEIVSKDAKVNAHYGLEKFYISKEDIIALRSGKKLYSDVNSCEYAITIEMEESEEKQESKKGYWIIHNGILGTFFECSECGTLNDARTNFCPDCGDPKNFELW